MILSKYRHILRLKILITIYQKMKYLQLSNDLNLSPFWNQSIIKVIKSTYYQHLN